MFTSIPGFALDPEPDAANTVSLLALLLALHDQVNQPLILCFLFLPAPPCVISAAAYLEYLAHGFDTVFPTEAFNDPILQLRLLPASDRKFRSNSTCIRSFTISLYFLASSLTGSLRGRPLGRGMYPAASFRSLAWCPVHCAAHFFSCQPQACSDFSVRFSCFGAFFNDADQMLDFRILSCHVNDLLS